MAPREDMRLANVLADVPAYTGLMAATRRRVKTSGGLYQRKSDGMWCASVELPAPPGERRRKVIVRAKKTDARNELNAALERLRKTGDLPTKGTTVAQWCDIWWEQYGMKRLKVSTRATYKSKIEQYIKPSIGKLPLDKLTIQHVYRMHSYITETKGISAASAMAAHRVLSVIIADAEREDRVGRNVVKLAAKPRVGSKKKVYLDNAQARELLLSCREDLHQRARWTVALLTGMRQGERLGLTIDMLDFENETITKAWQLRRIPFQHGCGERLEDGTWPCGRKRGGNCTARRLDVPEDQEVVPLGGGLFHTRPKATASRHVLPLQGAKLLWDVLRDYTEKFPPGDHGLIFTRPDGRPIDPADDSGDWHAALERAGLPDVDGHSARHSCNTILTELGFPVDVRKQILGQASTAVNEVYTHTADRRVAEGFQALSAALDYRT